MVKTPSELKKYYQDRFRKAGRDLVFVSHEINRKITSGTIDVQIKQNRLDMWHRTLDIKPVQYSANFLGLSKSYVTKKAACLEKHSSVNLVEQSECSSVGQMIFYEGKSYTNGKHEDMLSYEELKRFLTNTFIFNKDLYPVLSEVFTNQIAPEPQIKIVQGGEPETPLIERLPQKLKEPSKNEFRLENDNVLSAIGNWWKKNENIENYRHAINSYDDYLDKWNEAKRLYDQLQEEVLQDRTEYQKAVSHLENVNNISLRNFENHKALHSDFVKSEIEKIRKKISAYKSNDGTVSHQFVEEYFELVYRLSPQPKIFPRNIELYFDPESQILMCSLELPNFNHLPLHKVVQGKTKPLNQSEKKDAFEYGIFATWLRVAHEFAKADTENIISKICINGWLTYIDNADGRTKTSVVLSSIADAADYSTINVERADPKSAFRALNGRASPQPSNYSPVTPVLRLDKQDRRLRESAFTAESMDKDTNLAAMDWEEFEHLVRELFSKEFSSDTTEVKVTQASRDGGVDAIAYDDDPIRGGKFVIQAKRYTNTVDVAAVRELYAVVIDEGANRGILVTTSSFGPDAYDYVKDKPITLLNGNELLGLLERHGHSFRINLAEAKKINR